MIENISSTTAEKSTLKIPSQFKMPKNIRQIGRIDDKKRIYIEDYVMSFVKQLCDSETDSCKSAVLMGQYIDLEEGKCIFAQGAVVIQCEDILAQGEVTNENWTQVYEQIKRYFPESEIVGWVLVGPSLTSEIIIKVKKIFLDHFAGRDKALLLYEALEKEEGFYLYERHDLKKQEGYYIYYERNNEMQTYMMDYGSIKSNEEEYIDTTTVKIRQKFEEKKEEKENKNLTRLMYATGSLMIVVILAIASAMMNNFERMRNLEQALETISSEMNEGDAETLAEKMDNENLSELEKAVNQSIKKYKEVENAESTESREASSGKVTVIDNTGLDKELLREKEKENTTPTISTLPPTITSKETPIVTPTSVSAAETASMGKIGLEDNTDETEENYQVLPASMDSFNYYIVESGDTLAGISLKLYGSYTYLNQIIELNDISDENMIFAGQKLIIP